MEKGFVNLKARRTDISRARRPRDSLFTAFAAHLEIMSPPAAWILWRRTGSMISPDSSLCYLEIDNGVFLGDSHWDNYLHRFSIPELESTRVIRFVDFLHRRSLSSDGRWLMIVQGSDNHERIVVFDASSMKPVEWLKS